MTRALLVLAVAAPLTAVLVAAAARAGEAGERLVARAAWLGCVISLVANLGMLGLLAAGRAASQIDLGAWIAVAGHELRLRFSVDGVGLSFAATSALVTAGVARFSCAYLHRDPGFRRYFGVLGVFAFGMQVIALAGTLDVLFVGWELVGLASFLLIGFFRHRPGPVRGALRALIVYRTCDVALLLATLLLHHRLGHSAFSHEGAAGDPIVTFALLLLLVGASGKSAQFPAGSWLGTAMEGPTPSSAAFYGALSVHAGAFLVLRAEPLFAHDAIARTAMGAMGAVTATTSSLAARSRADVKGGIAAATQAQVGLIFVEVALGFPRLALAHLVAHAFFRGMEVLRSPSIVADTTRARVGVGLSVEPHRAFLPRVLSRWELPLHVAASERFYADRIVEATLVAPVRALSGWLASRAPSRRWPAAALGAAAVLGLLAGRGAGGSSPASVGGTVLLGASFAFWALGHTDIRRVVTGVVASQLLVVLSGAMASHDVGLVGALGQLAVTAGVGMLLLVLLSRVARTVGPLDVRVVGGLGADLPATSNAVLFSALLLAGFPGSPSFRAEDLLVGALVDEHPAVASVFLVVTALNGWALLAAWARIFLGPRRGPRPGTGTDLGPRVRAALAAALALALAVGICPWRS